MRMPISWLHRSCDSLARSVFLRARFCQPFSSFSSAFFFFASGSSPFSSIPRSFFFVFLSVFFLEGLVHMPRNTLNSISALLDPHGPASSLSDESAPPRLNKIPLLRPPLPHRPPSQRRLCHRPFSQAFQQSLPQTLATFRENGAPNSSSGTPGNSSAASSATTVPWTYTSTSTACHLSSLAGSVTVPSFLSTYASIGIPVVPRASQPPVPALSAPFLFDSSLVPSTSSLTLAQTQKLSISLRNIEVTDNSVSDWVDNTLWWKP